MSIETFLREDLSSVLTEGSVVLSDGLSDGSFGTFSNDLSPVDRFPIFGNIFEANGIQEKDKHVRN